MSTNRDDQHISASYRKLRRTVGILGIALPLVLLLYSLVCGDCSKIKPSISDYYDSNMRDIFVGILFTIGWFLFAYEGYETRDKIAGNLACIFSLGVALFPTKVAGIIQALHYISATGLFATLIYFSVFLFPKTGKGGCLFELPKFRKGSGLPQDKLKRNRIYVFAGLVMSLCLVAIIIYKCFLHSWLYKYAPVFWLEFLMLVAFGFSWFVKGDTLFKDKKGEQQTTS